MELFKNGYVVAKLNVNDKAYDAWPLADLPNDKIAEALTDWADNEWFCKYDMQHIVPDLDYARIYLNYCKSIKLPVKMLLFESLDSTITINDEVRIEEFIGFDCIATVYYSYLQSGKKEFKADLLSKNICLNKNGLANSMEDVLEFIKIRREVIASGVNLEDFWKEIPVKISVVET